MSVGVLFELKPEMSMDRARAELRQQGMVLRLIAETMEKPGVTLAELDELIAVEMPEVRTGLALARNFMAEAMKQREALQPALELFNQRVEGGAA